MKKKQTKRDYHARLVVYGINEMSDFELRQLCGWLKKTAETIDGMATNQYATNPIWRLMK